MSLILKKKASNDIVAIFPEVGTNLVDTENYEMHKDDIREKKSKKVILHRLDAEEIMLMDCVNYEFVDED